MTRLCGIDIETSGLNMEEDRITEIAWVIKPHAKTRSLVDKRYYVKGTKGVPPEVTELTGIRVEHCEHLGRELHAIVEEMLADFDLCKPDYLVAHNGGSFDIPWLLHHAPSLKGKLPPLLDTLTDVPYPKSYKTRQLPYLCAEMGFLNPFPHNAIADVWAMLKILDMFELRPCIERMRSPMVVVKAHVTYDNRQQAKDHSYRWERYRNYHFPKTWIKPMKQLDLAGEQERTPFMVEVIHVEENGQTNKAAEQDGDLSL